MSNSSAHASCQPAGLPPGVSCACAAGTPPQATSSASMAAMCERRWKAAMVPLIDGAAGACKDECRCNGNVSIFPSQSALQHALHSCHSRAYHPLLALTRIQDEENLA